MARTWTEREMIFPGIWVYRNAISPDLNVIERMENILSSSSQYQWKEAMVGYMEKMPEYRDCVDFKIRQIPEHYRHTKEDHEVNRIWEELYDAQIDAVNDYCNAHHIKMDFWEVMNFIRYGENQHFQEHADHGFSYMATVSLVGYPNDDYDGGDLVFPKLGIQVKPKAGDLYLFPSTYIYSHIAMPVHNGTKYSVVTMLDYNDNAHNDEYYQLRDRRIKEGKQKPVIR